VEGERFAYSQQWVLLPRHGDPEPLLGIDGVVVIILAQIELHPVDLAREPAVARGVIRGDRGCHVRRDYASPEPGEIRPPTIDKQSASMLTT
jgi:hypothetical protein